MRPQSGLWARASTWAASIHAGRHPVKLGLLAPSSIRRQLVVATAVLLALLTTAVIASLVLRQRSIFGAEHAERTRVMAGRLAAQLAPAAAADDLRVLQAGVDGLRSVPDLQRVLVADAQGRVRAWQGDGDRPDRIAMPGMPMPTLLSGSFDGADVITPILDRGRTVGWVRITSRSTSAGDALTRALREGLLGAALAILLGMGLAWSLGHRVTGRLYGLLDVADATRQGRRDLRAPGSRVYEVARLAESFNGMLDALAEREQALGRYNQELEACVEERTAELAESTANHRAILEQANDAFIMTDEDGRVVEWNRAARTTFGYSRSQATGRLLTDLIIPEAQRAAHRDGIRRYVESGDTTIVGRRIELVAVTREGHELPVEMSMRARWRGEQRFFDAFLRDITERKQLETSLAMQALHDSLTGLPNRRLLLESLPRALQRADRNAQGLAVFFLDLDGFKAVNDTFGHDAGDAVLREFACRIRDSVRAVDMVARLAGDEFVVVAEAFNEPTTNAATVAGKLLRVGHAPYETGDTQRVLSSSVGVAVYLPGSGVDAQALLARADQAMYTAKRAGKGVARTWEPSLAEPSMQAEPIVS